VEAIVACVEDDVVTEDVEVVACVTVEVVACVAVVAAGCAEEAAPEEAPLAVVVAGPETPLVAILAEVLEIAPAEEVPCDDDVASVAVVAVAIVSDDATTPEVVGSGVTGIPVNTYNMKAEPVKTPPLYEEMITDIV